MLVHGFARWGNQLWSRLNGMFAVAVWDRAQRTLTLARDRLGKKPLYISRCAGGFAIGSELKAVLCVPGVARDVDLVALEQFLAFDYTIGPRTILDGTSKLLGGCYAELTADSYDVTRYWEPRVQPRRPSEGSVAELDRLLDESTRRRLIADVPVGLFLSGGLDSTTVGYYMRRHAEDVQSFSIGFEEEGFDESRYSTLAARALGTKHHLEVFAADRMRDLIPRIAEVLDEPMGDQSIFPTYLLSTITREHVKVALGGDGSDEILMGYRSFLPLKVAWSLDRVPPLRDAIAATASALPNEFAGRAIRGLAFARRLERPPVQRLLSVLGAFRGDARWVMAPSARSSLPSSGFDEPDRHFAAPGGNRVSASDATVLVPHVAGGRLPAVRLRRWWYNQGFATVRRHSCGLGADSQDPGTEALDRHLEHLRAITSCAFCGSHAARPGRARAHRAGRARSRARRWRRRARRPSKGPVATAMQRTSSARAQAMSRGVSPMMTVFARG